MGVRSQGIVKALKLVARGEMDGDTIRDRYFDGFDMASARLAWEEVIKK